VPCVLKFLFNTALRMLMLAAMVYVTFFVPLGSYTLYRHSVRIGSTSEAQELWSAVGSACLAAKDRASELLGNRAAAQANEPASN
jgi:hypothetical protein